MADPELNPYAPPSEPIPASRPKTRLPGWLISVATIPIFVFAIMILLAAIHAVIVTLTTR